VSTACVILGEYSYPFVITKDVNIILREGGNVHVFLSVFSLNTLRTKFFYKNSENWFSPRKWLNGKPNGRIRKCSWRDFQNDPSNSRNYKISVSVLSKWWSKNLDFPLPFYTANKTIGRAVFRGGAGSRGPPRAKVTHKLFGTFCLGKAKYFITILTKSLCGVAKLLFYHYVWFCLQNLPKMCILWVCLSASEMAGKCLWEHLRCSP
jgi:hypothetical protein